MVKHRFEPTLLMVNRLYMTYLFWTDLGRKFQDRAWNRDDNLFVRMTKVQTSTSLLSLLFNSKDVTLRATEHFRNVNSVIITTV